VLSSYDCRTPFSSIVVPLKNDLSVFLSKDQKYIFIHFHGKIIFNQRTNLYYNCDFVGCEKRVYIMMLDIQHFIFRNFKNSLYFIYSSNGIFYRNLVLNNCILIINNII